LVIERSSAPDFVRAKGDAEALQAVVRQRDVEAGEYWHALDELRSRRLVNKAQKLFIPLEDVRWKSDCYANFFLDGATRAKLHRAIIEERRKVWDFRLRIIGAIATIITVLTGLLGAYIGVLAFLRRK